MKSRRRGLLTVAVVSVLGVSMVGCSSGTESATLRFVPSGGMGNETASDSKMVWADVSYEVEGTLPEMPSKMMSYEVKEKSAPVAEFENIAQIFGVEGEAKKDPATSAEFEEIFQAYSIGDSDMSDDNFAEAMWMYGDGRLWTWSYYPGSTAGGTSSSDSSDSSSGSAVDPSEPCAPDDTECLKRIEEVPVPVEPPLPPENIPSKSEVEKLTQKLLTDLGVELADVEIQAFTDEWSAWSQTQLLLDGIASPISWYFTFGENSELTSATGMLVDVQESTSYDLADATSAVSRLGDYRYYGGYGAAEARDASISSVEIAPVDEGSSGGGSAGGDAPVSTDDTTIVDDTVSTDVPVAPEKITVTITSVKMSYAWMFEANGKQVLMPAFTYLNDDGEVGTVVALSDDLFKFEEVTDTTVDDGEPTPEPDPGMDNPIPAEKANTLIGLTEDEAMVAAKNEGWEFRVAARDGEEYMLTTDYVMNRVNVTIVDGAVTEVTVG